MGIFKVLPPRPTFSRGPQQLEGLPFMDGCIGAGVPGERSGAHEERTLSKPSFGYDSTTTDVNRHRPWSW